MIDQPIVIDTTAPVVGDDTGGYTSSPPVASRMTAAEAAEHELYALGLLAHASAREIAGALQRHFPDGLSTSMLNPQTGLPFTDQTMMASAHGQIAGQLDPTASYVGVDQQSTPAELTDAGGYA